MENKKKKYSHMRIYCMVGGEVIKEGDKAYLIRTYDEETHRQKYMIICKSCYEYLNMKNGKEITFGEKKHFKPKK